MKQEAEEIPDTEHELVLERVCAIDVAKDSGKVCVRLSSRAGRRVSKVWDVPARSGAVAELAEHLLGRGSRNVASIFHISQASMLGSSLMFFVIRASIVFM